LVTFPTLLFEDQNFVAFEVAFNLSRHFRAAYRWGANSYISLVVDEEDVVKFDLFALFSVQAVDENLLVFLYLELVPCDLYDCIHDD
jgi:hypothetical protein